MNENEQWLRDRVCSCERYIYSKNYDYAKEFQAMLRPPTCAACGKWADRIQRCVRCNQHYYQFFWHPRMGWEPSIKLQGWECYPCLENFARHVNCKVNCTKTPPAELVVSPYFQELKPEPLDTRLQSVVDDFDAFLKSI